MTIGLWKTTILIIDDNEDIRRIPLKYWTSLVTGTLTAENGRVGAISPPGNAGDHRLHI